MAVLSPFAMPIAEANAPMSPFNAWIGPEKSSPVADSWFMAPARSSFARLASAVEDVAFSSEAVDAYRDAANRTMSTAERNYLLLRAAHVADGIARRQVKIRPSRLPS